MPVTTLGAPHADAILRQITTESVVTAPKLTSTSHFTPLRIMLGKCHSG
jgi:hypothetical protein